MTQAMQQHTLKSGWTLLQQALLVFAVALLVFSPLAGHGDAHAGQMDRHMSIAAELPDNHHEDGEADTSLCCHASAVCASIVLTKPVVVSQPMTLSLVFRQSGTALWQGRQAEPKLRPPIL